MITKGGVIAKLPDGRLCIIYNHQPLAQVQGKVILNLVDEKYNLIRDDSGKPKIIMKNVEVYNEEMQAATFLGYVD